MIQSTYQTVMGIHDHTRRDSTAFDIVRAHDSEDTFLTTRRCKRMQEYNDSSVYEVLRLNWIDFNKLTIPHADQALAMSRKIRRIQSENQLSITQTL